MLRRVARISTVRALIGVEVHEPPRAWPGRHPVAGALQTLHDVLHRVIDGSVEVGLLCSHLAGRDAELTVVDEASVVSLAVRPQGRAVNESGGDLELVG